MGYVLLAIGVVVFVFAGAGLGIAAFNRSKRNAREIERLSFRLRNLESERDESQLSQSLEPEERLHPASPPHPSPEAVDSLSASVDEKPETADDPHKVEMPLGISREQRPARITPPPIRRAAPASLKKSAPDLKAPSLEFVLGTKWMSWVGILMFTIGIGFGLKYAYDRQWMPPELRLAISVLSGLAALGVAEFFRRKGHTVLFQTLTGGGVGILYLCAFFSYRIYEFTGPELSMALGILVTTLGIVMAVAHDAMPIAVLAVAGGFIAPLLFSDGGNRPYALFTYIVLLDLVALGAAYYRNWRVLNLLCFAGTTILYQLWFTNAYEETDRTAGLIFTSLFYLMFLLIPTVYSLVRRVHLQVEALTLIIINALYSLYAFYGLLIEDYRMVLGFVVIAQANLVFGLFWFWSKRVSGTDRTAESLLVITLALVTLAIPIQFRSYGLPIAWSVEGALFIYLGLRHDRRTSVIGGAGALLLATIGLIVRLPIHTLPFTPILNQAFGSWLVVIASVSVATVLFRRHFLVEPEDRERLLMALCAALLAYALTCLALSLELAAYWTVHKPVAWRGSMMASLTLLWTLIPSATAALVLWREWDRRALALSWVGYGIGTIVFIIGLDHYGANSVWFGGHKQFPAGLLLIVSIWTAARFTRGVFQDQPAKILEIAANVLLVVLMAAEFSRWGGTPALTKQLARALLSCAWALQAFLLIWYGLATRVPLRRIMGFVLFALTVAHVVLIAINAKLDPALQIVSFIGSGLLLLAAAAFYSRFSKVFLEEEEADND